MSAAFVLSSSQHLINTSPPFITYPYSVGFWVYPQSVNNGQYRVWWGQGDTGGTNNHYTLLGQGPGTDFTHACDGGTSIAEASGGTVVVNTFYYVIGRGVSATNRWLAVLTPIGTIHAQNTTSRTPSGLDNMTIGNLKRTSNNNFCDARIAEFWCTATDIQADGAQLDDNLLRQLAYGGPFSVPNVAANLLEYRSFRKVIESDQDEAPGDELYWGGAGRQVWTNTNGVTRGPHPPLPGWYRKPADARVMVPF